MSKTDYNCPYCKANLTTTGSVVRAFYVAGTDSVVYAKAHYTPEPFNGLPAGTTCFDSHQDIEIDPEIHDDNDKCASCRGDICADTIKSYDAYVNQCNGTPLSYEDWH